MKRYCAHCGNGLIGGDNWTPSDQRRNRHICRFCAAIPSKAWNAANPEKVKEQRRRWREKHGETIRAKARAKYAANRVEILAKAQAKRDAAKLTPKSD